MIGMSSLAILDKKGKSLLLRNYRADIPPNHLELFNRKYLEHDPEIHPPIITHGDTHFLFIKHENLRLLAASRSKANALLIFSFLESFRRLLADYLISLEADTVRDNTIMIYELMDEIVDNGHPTTTDFKLLQKHIKTHANLAKGGKKKQKRRGLELAQAMASAVPWRSGKYKYGKNEVFLDVVEKINMVITTNGRVLKSEVEGSLKMNSRLSGMPELLLGINDKKFFDINRTASTGKKTVDIQDIKFHQCVRLAKFENDRSISFIPPDGEFDLINYRMECGFKGLFALEIDYRKETERRVEFTVHAKSNYKDKVAANFVEFWIPVPKDAQNVKTRASKGKGKYVPDNDVIQWKAFSLGGKKEISMEVGLDMPSISSGARNFRNLPVRVFFDIPYYTLSGLNVRYLKIKEKSGYHALSWVRYIAKNGEFVIRTNKSVV